MHVAQATLNLPEGSDVNEVVQKLWEKGCYVKLTADAPNAVSVCCDSSMIEAVRAYCHDPKAAEAVPEVVEGTESTEGNEAPPAVV